MAAASEEEESVVTSVTLSIGGKVVATGTLVEPAQV